MVFSLNFGLKKLWCFNISGQEHFYFFGLDTSFQPSDTDELMEVKSRTGTSQASEINAGIVQKTEILYAEGMCLRPSPCLMAMLEQRAWGPALASDGSCSQGSCLSPLFLCSCVSFCWYLWNGCLKWGKTLTLLSLYITAKSLWLLPWCSFNGMSVASPFISWTLIFYLNPISNSEAFFWDLIFEI